MSTQMEVDDNATAATLSNAFCIEPELRTSPFVKKGGNCTLFVFLVP